jgi:hypothetical protein
VLLRRPKLRSGRENFSETRDVVALLPAISAFASPDPDRDLTYGAAGAIGVVSPPPRIVFGGADHVTTEHAEAAVVAFFEVTFGPIEIHGPGLNL